MTQPEPALGRPVPATFGGGHQPARPQPMQQQMPPQVQQPAQPYPQPQPAAPAAGPAAYPQPVDYQQVDADTYHQQVQRQQQAERQQPIYTQPIEAPRDPVGQHVADLRAEVDVEQARDAGEILGDNAEAEGRIYPPGSTAVSLEGSDGRWGIVHILPADEWPSDANSAMHVSDFESWADGCLALDDYEQIWCQLRPRLKHIGAMLKEWRALTGQDTGKSLRSPNSLRNAARR